jgi:adenylate cyclase
LYTTASKPPSSTDVVRSQASSRPHHHIEPGAAPRSSPAARAQLIDAVTGTHLWADRFDGSLEDVFELQDQIAISAAGVIEPTLQVAETRRVFL